MDVPEIVILVGLPLFWLLAMAGYAYINAPTHGMRRKKWAAISFCVPLFGFFAYLFEREEKNRDPNDREMFTDGPFEIHESRADDVPVWNPDSPEEDQTETQKRK